MTRYYIGDPNSERGFVELTYSEWIALLGTEETAPYASRVYRGEIMLEEVPEELREAVKAVADAKIARWGQYTERELSDTVALDIITGGATE